MTNGSSTEAHEAAASIDQPTRWSDAQLAARVLRHAGSKVGGLWLKARAGGVRDLYLERLKSLFGPAKPWTRLPATINPHALLSSVDIQATTLAGRIVRQPGILARAQDAVLLIPMAEQIEASSAALIGDALDRASCPAVDASAENNARDEASFIVVAMDESAEPEERMPAVLEERLGLMVDLNAVSWTEASSSAHPDEVEVPGDVEGVFIQKELLGLLSQLACEVGAPSLRTLRHLSVVCRTLAALDGRNAVSEADALTAVRLSLGLNVAPHPEQVPKEACQPAHAEQDDENPRADKGLESRPPEQDTLSDGIQELSALSEFLSEVQTASRAGLPDLGEMSSRLSARSRSGKSGAENNNSKRGRPVSISRTPNQPNARPNVIATLRAAAPWQHIRSQRRATLAAKLRDAQRLPTRQPRVLVKSDDYRYQRLRHNSQSTAIFLVDASGSTALERLGETKGAIEQLLARCYVRRDEVAMITFRGREAQTILPPTRSLVMAKRKLSALPGGGPTPLAAGLERGLELALSVQRQGSTPVLVLLTDGRGNIALDGRADRSLAADELTKLATRCRSLEMRSICIDIARRPRPAVSTLAEQMGADLHFLQHADARTMSDVVNASLEEARG